MAQASTPPEGRVFFKFFSALFRRLLRPRRRLSTPVQIVTREVFPGFTESISFSGVSVRMHEDFGPLNADLRNLDLIFPELQRLRVTAEVVGYRDRKLHLRFRNLSTKDRGVLASWMEGQDRDVF